MSLENGKTVEELGIEMDNLLWRNSLPLYEQFMLRDYIDAYKMNILGVEEGEYKRLKSISGLYVNVELFYGPNSESIRKINTVFDKRLTKEEACLKYCGCDIDTAKKIHNDFKSANKETVLHEKSIREAYNGDLSIELGIDKEKYLEEEKSHLAKVQHFASKMKVRPYNQTTNV